MKIVVIGVSGLIGSTVFKTLRAREGWQVFGTLRSEGNLSFFPGALRNEFVTNLDVLDTDALMAAMGRLRPDVIVNCAGLTKHMEGAYNPLLALPINSLFPHRLHAIAQLF